MIAFRKNLKMNNGSSFDLLKCHNQIENSKISEVELKRSVLGLKHSSPSGWNFVVNQLKYEDCVVRSDSP